MTLARKRSGINAGSAEEEAGIPIRGVRLCVSYKVMWSTSDVHYTGVCGSGGSNFSLANGSDASRGVLHE